jgi:hypothetical protein
MVPPSNIPPPPETTPQERLDALRRKADQADGLLNAASEPASPPAPATVSAPTPIPDQPGASTGQKIWMGLGLTLLTGLGTLPVLLILWVLGTTMGVVLIAEALERTRGLAPATFGGAFWLAAPSSCCSCSSRWRPGSPPRGTSARGEAASRPS